MPRPRLSKEARARRYLQASMEAGYTGLPAEHKRAKQSLMAAHERAYPRVREHALAGAARDFDLPLTSGERGHQRHLREQEGLTESDVRDIRAQLRAKPARRETRGSETSRSSPLTAPASSSAAAASGALGAAASGKGNLFLQLAGMLLGLSLIYLLVAGKGVKALTGLMSVVTGGVRAFIAPVDPIASLEGALGAAPISRGSSGPSSGSSSEPASSAGKPSKSGGGFLAAGEKLLQYGRQDQGRDIQLTPGAGLYAPGAGYVVRVASDPSGFGPDYPVDHFTSGPYKGRDVYLGHTDAILPTGSRFKRGALLAKTSKTGHNAPPGWAEIGFAPGGSPGAMGQSSPF